MKLSKILKYTLLLGIWCLVFGASIESVKAFYDPRTKPNNKAGVHILSPDEIVEAAKLVNSNGGDWGYVIIPIQPTDRDKDKWQTFMKTAKEKHLIPIIRVTTIPDGGTWATPEDTGLVDFANFLSELDWPIENRYIVLFNEVNRSTEWGDKVDPEKYATIVKNAYAIFKERSSDFFILGPSLDSALPNSATSLSAKNYLSRMGAHDPLVWTYFDGWSSHSYPNPGFLASPKQTGMTSIVGYKSEQSYLNLAPKPVFITETGWDQSKLSSDRIAQNWSIAWDIWQKDPNVVSVTPFVFSGGNQFAIFSLKNENGEYSASGQSIFNLPKTAGEPVQVEKVAKVEIEKAVDSSSWELPFFKSSRALHKLENIFRVVMGLPSKAHAQIKNSDIIIELAETPKQWEKGLSDRTVMGNIDGMLFIFPQKHVPVFWMKNMHFAIDMIWINDGTVVDITQSAPPPSTGKLPTYSPIKPVNMVLETRAGWAAENGIAVGDKLTIE